MGVAGLWTILRPAQRQQALLQLMLEPSPGSKEATRAAYRLGIDASIWFYHAAYSRQGENHELRLIFFRLAQLLRLPSCIPLFVFDGPDRPVSKRGKQLTKKRHWMEGGMKALIEAFGFAWMQAPGEAEAELARLNRLGLVHAVMTDDVDALVFGAPVVIRNLAATGSPRAVALDISNGMHVAVYRMSDIKKQETDGGLGLSLGGLVLIALLSGSDYNKGIPGCGTKISYALAQAGLGDELPTFASALSDSALAHRLGLWRSDLRCELRTNARGYLGHAYPSIATSITDSFPNLDILRAYVAPVAGTCTSFAGISSVTSPSTQPPNVARIAACCETYFEWGFQDAILNRFRNLIWPGICGRLLLSWAQEGASGRSDSLVRFSASFLKICSQRRHLSTGHLLEYRLEISPSQLNIQTVSELKGSRLPTSTSGHFNPSRVFRCWFLAAIVDAAIPDLAADFSKQQLARAAKQAKHNRPTKRRKIDTSVHTTRSPIEVIDLTGLSD